MRRCRARSRRPWQRRCGLVGSAVLRATFWPTTALLLLLLRVSECVEAVSEWCRSVSIDTSVGRVDSVQKCPKVSKCQLTLVSKGRAGAQGWNPLYHAP